MTGRTALVIAGELLFAASLPMVAIDDEMGGELLRGFEVRGYQCLFGAVLAPVAVPWATPLWLSISLGHIGAVLTPVVLWWAPAARARRAVKVMLTLGAVAACLVLLLRTSIGVTRLYTGAFVWCLALVLLAGASWLWPPSSTTSRRWRTLQSPPI